ncbi:MAG: ester cyclase [Cyclobacteriaceae bacterium]|nr:ester cyclase [Cyclobacteriaceae bacterium]
MATTKLNKELIIRFVNELNAVKKERHHIEQFVADEVLVQHFLFFDHLFPGNELLIDELTAEGNRVILRTRMKGRHDGTLKGISATHRSIEYPMVFGFEIERKKIIHHWLLADQAKLLEQLRMT